MNTTPYPNTVGLRDALSSALGDADPNLTCRFCGRNIALPPTPPNLSRWAASLKPPRLACARCIAEHRQVQANRSRPQSLFAWTSADVIGDPQQAMALIGAPLTLKAANLAFCPDLPAALVTTVGTWAREPKGFLFLTGAAGSGKSWLAVATLLSIVQTGRANLADAKFISEGDYLRSLRTAYDSGQGDVSARLLPARDARKVPLLVFDDLGSSYLTDWGSSVLADLIRLRHESNLVTIVTSNLDLGQVAKTIDTRTTSRIAESGQVLTFPSTDLRIGKIPRDVAAIRENQRESASIGNPVGN